MAAQSRHSWRYIFRILPYLRPYGRLAGGSSLLMVVSAAVSLLAPWPLKILVDSVLGPHPVPAVLAPVLGVLADDRYAILIAVAVAGLAIALLENGLALLGSYVNSKLELLMVLDLRSDMFQHAQRLSLAFHDHSRMGGLMYCINNQASAVGSVTLMLPPLVQSALTLAGMFWIASRLDATLALISLSVVPFLYYSVGFYTNHIESRLRRVKGMEGESLAIVHEAMSMLRVIMAFGREQHEYRRFRRQGEDAVHARVDVTVRQTLFSMAVNVITAAGSALVLGFGAHHVLQGTLTVGELLVILSYIASVYAPLAAISSTVGSMQDQLINLQMACDLMDTEAQLKDLPGAVTIERGRGEIAFEGVSFSYQGRDKTLEDITFRSGAGQIVGIVGPTGAGKSTLAGLIPRFWDPLRGRILLDGLDIRQITVKSLRQQISIVLQEPLLFSGTIGDNIRYGRLEASREEVMQAARSANAHDFILSLPEGYETTIGERGAQLSIGERQRISVARAFLKDAPILILDEPTSSVDSKTEEGILDALDRLMAGRTTFLIAHRFSTLRNAGLILVLQHGRVVEQGTHHVLMQNGGLYRELHDLQFESTRSTPAAGALQGAGIN